MKEQLKLREELVSAIKDDGLVSTRYEALRFVYHYFEYYNKKSVPLWAFDLVDELYYSFNLLQA